MFVAGPRDNPGTETKRRSRARALRDPAAEVVMQRLEWLIVLTMSLPATHPFREPAVDKLSTRLARRFRARQRRLRRAGANVRVA
jgi:hypothetical protein